MSGPPESPAHSPLPFSCCRQITLARSQSVRFGHALAETDADTLSLCKRVFCRPGGLSISPQPMAVHALKPCDGNPLSETRTTLTASVMINGFTRIRAKSSLASLETEL